VAFRNFIHEQQFYSWQHRSGQLYGTGLLEKTETENVVSGTEQDGGASTNG